MTNSENEGFLARWSKRKAEARVKDEVDRVDGAPRHDPARATGTLSTEQAEPDGAVEEIALADLPPLDSIDASTDLTPWLKKGVPDAWKQAAYSRVWAADPMINQFTGLADYAWDYNAPDGGVPGFGPIRATDNVIELLAQAIGQVPGKKKEEPENEADTDLVASIDADKAEDLQTAVLAEASDDVSLDEKITYAPHSDIIRNEHEKHEEPQAVRRRRGGSALPV